MSPPRTAQNGQSLTSAKQDFAGASSDRYLTLLVEGTAETMLAIDAASYEDFRETVSKMARQVREGQPDADKLAITKNVLREFESYQIRAQATLRELQNSWRTLGALLLEQLLGSMGIRANSPTAIPLVEKMAELESAEDIQNFRFLLEEFLHPPSAEEEAPSDPSLLNAMDRSTANDNAAGLRGGGSAVEHLRAIMERGGRRGSVVFFRLGCLDIISERFGGEAVQDCLMAVAAYIAHSLHSDDVLFHWSDSALLAGQSHLKFS